MQSIFSCFSTTFCHSLPHSVVFCICIQEDTPEKTTRHAAENNSDGKFVWNVSKHQEESCVTHTGYRTATNGARLEWIYGSSLQFPGEILSWSQPRCSQSYSAIVVFVELTVPQEGVVNVTHERKILFVNRRGRAAEAGRERSHSSDRNIYWFVISWLQSSLI